MFTHYLQNLNFNISVLKYISPLSNFKRTGLISIFCHIGRRIQYEGKNVGV
jgi:hypothetical protein